MDTTGNDVAQDPVSISKNSDYFAANQRYARHVGSLDTYQEIRRAINAEIKGVRRLLDVGNGGVFDYDIGLVEEVTGVDLCLTDTQSAVNGNVTLRHGDALALNERNASYDMVLESFLFHHLIGSDVDSTVSNIARAVDEAHRVLTTEGRFVVVESCVSPRAFAVERRLFWMLRQAARTPLMRHPATLQLTSTMIAHIIQRRFGNVTVTPIAIGRWILQFGVRWPTVLTPARPYLFIAKRS